MYCAATVQVRAQRGVGDLLDVAHLLGGEPGGPAEVEAQVAGPVVGAGLQGRGPEHLAQRRVDHVRARVRLARAEAPLRVDPGVQHADRGGTRRRPPAPGARPGRARDAARRAPRAGRRRTRSCPRRRPARRTRRRTASGRGRARRSRPPRGWTPARPSAAARARRTRSRASRRPASRWARARRGCRGRRPCPRAGPSWRARRPWPARAARASGTRKPSSSTLRPASPAISRVRSIGKP